jgi:hypothetical protein
VSKRRSRGAPRTAGLPGGIPPPPRPEGSMGLLHSAPPPQAAGRGGRAHRTLRKRGLAPSSAVRPSIVRRVLPRRVVSRAAATPLSPEANSLDLSHRPALRGGRKPDRSGSVNQAGAIADYQTRSTSARLAAPQKQRPNPADEVQAGASAPECTSRCALQVARGTGPTTGGGRSGAARGDGAP